MIRHPADCAGNGPSPAASTRQTFDYGGGGIDASDLLVDPRLNAPRLRVIAELRIDERKMLPQPVRSLWTNRRGERKDGRSRAHVDDVSFDLNGLSVWYGPVDPHSFMAHS